MDLLFVFIGKTREIKKKKKKGKMSRKESWIPEKTNTLEPKLYIELRKFVTTNRYTMKI